MFSHPWRQVKEIKETIYNEMAPRVAAEQRQKSLSPQELRDLTGKPTPSGTRQNVRCVKRV
jgi:hypothetical protein